MKVVKLNHNRARCHVGVDTIGWQYRKLGSFMLKLSCIEGPKELFACTLCKDVLGVAWQNLYEFRTLESWILDGSFTNIPVDLKGLRRLLGLCGKPWSVQRIGHVTGSTKRRCVARSRLVSEHICWHDVF